MSEKYQRGKKKKQVVKVRVYTCDPGDIVYHRGRPIMVQEIFEDGKEARQERAFIRGAR